MPSTSSTEIFHGEALEDMRGLLKRTSPMTKGCVTQWHDMESVWSYLYTDCLKVVTQDHPVLLTEPIFHSQKDRASMAQILFESFKIPALAFVISPVLTLYSLGKTTGLVLDSGDTVTQCVPICERFSMKHAMKRIDLAGRDITEQLQFQCRKSGFSFTTSAEFEILRTMKEKVCYVSATPMEDMRTILEGQDQSNLTTYTLPDGNSLSLTYERFLSPEILFDPSRIGSEVPSVPQCVSSAIELVDMDLRSQLYSNIVMAGGTTQCLGFGDRLLKELALLAPSNTKLRIQAPTDGQYAAWMGGSILASLSTFKKCWISAKDWQEYGSSILYRKSLF